MHKEYLPDGITEKKFVEIVYRVSPTSAKKFIFGYHSYEDMIQQSFFIAINILKGGKFKPRGDKPMEQQLANFLRVWIHNRLSNYRRDNSCRYPNKGGANQVKYNLMHPLKYASMGLTNSEIFARESDIPDEVSHQIVLDRLAEGFRRSERKLYDRYLGDEELSEAEQIKLNSAVQRILQGEPEEYI